MISYRRPIGFGRSRTVAGYFLHLIQQFNALLFSCFFVPFLHFEEILVSFICGHFILIGHGSLGNSFIWKNHYALVTF